MNYIYEYFDKAFVEKESCFLSLQGVYKSSEEFLILVYNRLLYLKLSVVCSLFHLTYEEHFFAAVLLVQKQRIETIVYLLHVDLVNLKNSTFKIIQNVL